MTQYNYIGTNYPLEEVEVGVRFLSIQEAIDAKVAFPNFFGETELTEEELNTPGTVMTVSDEGALSVQQHSVDQPLPTLIKTPYIYEFQMMVGEEGKVESIYQLLFTYLKDNYREKSVMEIWEITEGQEADVKKQQEEMSNLTANKLMNFFEEKVEENNRCLIIK